MTRPVPPPRALEAGIHRDLRPADSYGAYLALDEILAAQRPRSGHHDELLFIIQHQTAELWFKLVIHELQAACRHLLAGDAGPCEKNLARVKMVQRQLFEQWGVLETLTPPEYLRFRHVLGQASGFQSRQYRQVEFLLGNRNRDLLAVFGGDAEAEIILRDTIEAPSLYDCAIRFLAARGHPVPAALLDRDVSQAHEFSDELVNIFVAVYRDPERYWTEYALAERLVDVEDSFQLWRFRHLKTVERIIGHAAGTGGSSGVRFLRQALDYSFFPEIYAVRTEFFRHNGECPA